MAVMLLYEMARSADVLTVQKPWMKHIGRLRHLRHENVEIDTRIEEAFEHIDQELWS
jgi:hypothetical protein